MQMYEIDAVSFDSVPPDLGPVFLEYKNDPEGAIKRLMAEKTGDARSVVTRSGLGSIDLFYGSVKTGLAKIVSKHPEMLPKLSDLLRHGKIIKKPGAAKVFIVGDGAPADVAVIALDWYGAAKTWVVTSYVDERGVFTGDLKTIDTEALDSALMEVLYADQRTENTLMRATIGVKPSLDDTASAPDVAAMMARLKLTSELSRLRKQIAGLGGSPLDMLAKLKLVARANEVRKQLGAAVAAPAAQPEKAPDAVDAPVEQAPTNDDNDADEVIAAPEETPEVKKSLSRRQRDNNAAIAMLAKIKAGEADPKSPEVREVLKGYSGSGGGLTAADGFTGSPTEYYTPKPIAGAVWGVLAGMGFTGGKVLDPSSGMGVFAQTKPESVAIQQVEVDQVSGEINGLINNSETVSTVVSSFEEMAARTDDDSFDAVVTNVPFGSFAMRGGMQKHDPKYQKASLTDYFVLRAIDKVRPGGFVALIVSSSIVSGKGGKHVRLRTAASMKAEFIGAYRLPNQVFDEAGADVITDVIVFRKHGKEQAQKIEELKQQNPGVLQAARVLWDEFIDGNYFKMSGRRFQIGESQMGTGKFGEVEKVVHSGDIKSVAALMKPFDKTGRIDWDLLGATATAPIVYAEGDVIYSGGATLQFQDGKLVPLQTSVSSEDEGAIQILAAMKTPLDSIRAGITLDSAKRAVANEERLGRINDLPRWIVMSVRGAQTNEDFEAIIAGMCVHDLDGQRMPGEIDATNYHEAYPELTAAIGRSWKLARSRASSAQGMVREALESVAKARNRRGFTPWWMGDTSQGEARALLPSQAYERAKMELDVGDEWVSLDAMRKDNPDFDPLTDPGWCVSPDGKGVMHPRDYYVGNYGEFMRRAQQELEDATDPAVRQKLIEQHEAAKARLPLIDVSKMRFTLESAFVTKPEVLSFVQQYVSPDIELVTKADGSETFSFSGKGLGKYASAGEELERKALLRFIFFLNNGTITTGNNRQDAIDDSDTEKRHLEAIKAKVAAANAQFDTWCKASDVGDRIRDRLNAPENMRFIEEPDYAPLEIDGWNPARKPHDYQSATARRFAKRFSGIVGLDVGLGKTLSALATVQYVQSIGAKKRTVFAVPNSVLTNWKKEAAMSYTDMADCLFVGLGANGKYSPTNVNDDLASIVSGKYSKIFMTFETLEKIPLREETLAAYGRYLLENDDSFTDAAMEGDQKKKGKKSDALSQQAAIEKAIGGGEKSLAVPYFEDMGIDSIVIDECHAFKNSKQFSSKGFKATKFVANPQTSSRGRSMQAKCWYLRGMTPAQDGVMALTATPVTNSPLEIYAMLSLAMGEKEVNSMCGCTGADSFMNNFCKVETTQEENIIGELRETRTLTGIDNLALIRRVLESSCVIETVDTVAKRGTKIEVPESEEIAIDVDLTPGMTAELMAMAAEYKELNKAKKNGDKLSQAEAIKASAFNLIRRMTKMITDPELSDGEFRYTFAPSQEDKARAAVLAFNKLKLTEERKEYELPFGTDVSSMKSKTVIDTETGSETVVYFVPVEARIEGSTLIIPGTDFDTHDRMATIIDKQGLALQAKASPKVAALLENIRNENASPRWSVPKQIIFCDELAMHHKLRVLIAGETGIPQSKIAIVNAKSVNTDQMQAIQDGFNADGAEDSDEPNRYQIIIANKKAEVGINLQKGTQAIHHLTIGWTPDSIHQRNGRGVRQGNKIDTPIMVYHYDANGTFDAYKRHLVGVKGDWIGSVMDPEATSVDIAGDLGREAYERMGEVFGDKEAMAKIQEEGAARAREALTQANMVAQANAITNMISSEKWLAKFGKDAGFGAWIASKSAAIGVANSQIATLRERIEKTESDAVAKRCEAQIAELEAKIASTKAYVDTGGKTHNSSSFAGAFEGTAAHANWKKEVTLNTRMRDEAENNFRMRDGNGYTAATLENLKSGKAAAFNGRIISEGDLIVTEAGVPGLVRSVSNVRGANGMVLLQAADKEARDVALTSVTIAKHGPIGTPARAEIMRLLAANCDKAAQNKEIPAGLWHDNQEVRDNMTVAVPSRWVQPSSALFAAPVFPALLGDSIPRFAKQSEAQRALIEVKEGGYQTLLRFNDMRSMADGAADGEDRHKAVIAWLTANRERMTPDEFVALDMRFDREIRLSDSRDMLAKSKASAKSMNDLGSGFLAEIAAAYPWLDVTGEDALKIATALNIGSDYKAAMTALDDGSTPYPVEYSLGGYDSISNGMRRAVVEAVRAGGEMATLMASFVSGEGVNEALEAAFKIVGATVNGDRLEIGEPFASQIRAQMMVGPSAQPWVKKAALEALLRGSRDEIGGALRAAAAKIAADGLGLNVEALVDALRNHADITSASTGTTVYVKSRDRFTGAATLKAGQYLMVKTRYGSRLQEKISAKGAGLVGRVFDSPTKAWILSLVPVKMSDGTDFATAEALCNMAGIDYKKFTKG